MPLAEVRTLVELWKSGEFIAGVAADICERLAFHSQNPAGVAHVLHPTLTYDKVDEDERLVIEAGVALYKARKQLRKDYDLYWAKVPK